MYRHHDELPMFNFLIPIKADFEAAHTLSKFFFDGVIMARQRAL